MTPTERAHAGQAGRRKKKAARGNQTIVLRHFTINRLDELNWQVIYNGKPPEGADVPTKKYPWFYGRLVNALGDLPHKMLDHNEIGSVAEAVGHMKRIEQQIAELYKIKFEGKIGKHD